MAKRVLLGMSGGVDSSVSAMLLQEQGYDVLGVTFLFSGTDAKNHHFLEEAKQLAEKLEIKHFSVDLRKEFEEQVIQYFIDEYAKGKTPFPCAHCNPILKFKYLQEKAKELNCDFLATGHYVQTGIHNGLKYLYKGKDPEKDQSFFLWGLKREIVDKLILPLGGFEKNDIRNYARKNGFVSLSEKKDSLGICFIDGNDYRKFLEKRGIRSIPGNFVNKKGEVLGQHSGITNYTIGQRRGLGLNLNFPLFVAEIRPDANEIVLAKYDDLYCSKLILNKAHFVDSQIVNQNRELIVKVRYRLQETPCRLHILKNDVVEVELLKPEAMIASGQTAVFYDDNRLVGGGFIKSAK